MRRFFISFPMLACATVAARAKDYPNKPVRVVVPLSPGGGTDAARTMLRTGKVVKSSGAKLD